IDDDEIKIAHVNQEPERLARDEHRVSSIQRVNQQQYAATDREEPERHRDHARARALRCDPLHHEAHGEKSLRHESQNYPGIKLDDEDIVQIAGEIIEQVCHDVTSVAT